MKYLVVMTYKTKGLEAKPVWQVIDPTNNCVVVADDFKTSKEARKHAQRITDLAPEASDEQTESKLKTIKSFI